MTVFFTYTKSREILTCYCDYEGEEAPNTFMLTKDKLDIYHSYTLELRVY